MELLKYKYLKIALKYITWVNLLSYFPPLTYTTFNATVVFIYLAFVQGTHSQPYIISYINYRTETISWYNWLGDQQKINQQLIFI